MLRIVLSYLSRLVYLHAALPVVQFVAVGVAVKVWQEEDP